MAIIPIFGECLLIGASVSDPHTSESNCGFFIFICTYIYAPQLEPTVLHAMRPVQIMLIQHKKKPLNSYQISYP